jgi:hypothetical protein
MLVRKKTKVLAFVTQAGVLSTDHILFYLRLGASGESAGATPRATDARNSCLFCCTRQAALMILWRGVRR